MKSQTTQSQAHRQARRLQRVPRVVEQRGDLNRAIKEASVDFINTEKYDFSREFVNRPDRNGTRMPLSLNCYKLEIELYLKHSSELFASRQLSINGHYQLTNLGKQKLEYMNEIDKRIEDGYLERTTCGTVALWLLRKNERRRQLLAIKQRSKDIDWQTLRKHYKDYREEVISRVYKRILNRAIDYLTEIVETGDYERVINNIELYIFEQRKSNTSTVSPIYDRTPYDTVTEVLKFKEALPNYIAMLTLIRDNLYSEMRLNPKYILSAIRNRPLDLEKFTDSYCSGSMTRSREANGQPPFSLLWMFVYEIKKDILIEAIGEMEKLYRIKFIDPIRYDDFYYRYTQRKNGLYIFGDNGAVIKNNEIVAIYDLSISDVFQAWFRADNRKNFCFFIRIGEGYDCGSTGDAFTTIWNIDGQIFMWRIFQDGYLTSKAEFPETKELAEATRGFLGLYFDDEAEDFYVGGVKLTGDDANRAIPVHLERGGITRLSWEPKKKVRRNEILSLAICSGTIDLKLKEFYRWIEKWKLLTELSKEIYSMQERVDELIDVAPERFLELSDADLDYLAAPYILVD